MQENEGMANFYTNWVFLKSRPHRQ